MARNTGNDLIGLLTGRVLREKVGLTGRKQPPSALRGVIGGVSGVVGQIADRATGGPAKRKQAALKGAATRRRAAAKRSAAAKKGAKTRARNR